VLKHKSLVIMSVLVLVLAVVAMSCAPATPPAPPVVTPPVVTPPVVTPPVVTEPVVTPPVVAPVVEKPTSFESATYTDDANGFSFRYPKTMKVVAKLPYATAVFYANDGGAPLPTDLVFVDVRPATSVKVAGVAALGDFVLAKGVSADVKVVSEKEVTLADGKTAATEIALSASVMFQNKVGSCLGVIKNGKAITVLAGIESKNADLYKEICSTLVVK
jgi:hypothetical protein